MDDNKVCRICLTTKESFSYYLFENVAAEMFLFCTSIQVYEDDSLPKTLCTSCHDLLIKLSDFKSLCLQSQHILAGFVKNETQEIPIKNESSYDYHLEKVDVLLNADHSIDSSEDEDKTEAEQSISSSIEKPKTRRQRKERSASRIKKSFTSKNVLLHTPKKFLSCDICDQKFRIPEKYEAHKLEHQGKTSAIQCLTCNKIFSTWADLREHKETEHRLTECLQCPTCGNGFKTLDTFQTHILSAYCGSKDRKQYICDVCGKNLTNPSTLKYHLETHKDKREKLYVCHCGKKFFANATLVTHINTKHKGIRVVCPICNMPFATKNNLAKHLRRHNGIKPYSCDVCGKAFIAKSFLVEHTRIHTGEKPFSCSFCPKSFISKRRLKDHHLTHTGEKPHKCKMCTQAFSQRGTLKRHMRIHNKTMDGRVPT